MEDSALTIAGVARDAGVGVETVRYYERRGLIEQPSRYNGAVRRYGLEHVRRIQFVRRAQELGFTLDEIASLLELEDGTDRTRIRTIASARLAQVRSRIADLQRMERSLGQLLTACERERQAVRCPIIAALAAPTGR